MRLCELFDDKPVSLVADLRTLMIDVLTPLAANQVPFISVQQVVDRLRDVRSGARVDRNLVMTILDPNFVKVVKKIEGDRIYLTIPVRDEVAKTEDDAERDKDKIRSKAHKLAKKKAKSSGIKTSERAKKEITK